MFAAKAGHREIVELFKTKCNQKEPTDEMIVRQYHQVLVNRFRHACMCIKQVAIDGRTTTPYFIQVMHYSQQAPCRYYSVYVHIAAM